MSGFIFHNEIPNINHSLFPEYGWFPKNFPGMCFTLPLWHPLSDYRCRRSVLAPSSPNSLSNRIPLGTFSQKRLGLTCSSSPPCVLTPRLNLNQAMQVQHRKHWLREALQQQSFLKQQKKSCGTTSSCSVFKIQYIINKYVLKASKLNSENWRTQHNLFQK